MRRLLNVLPMALVMAATLAMVAYVGLGEAHRVNPRLQMEKLAVQGEVIRYPIGTFLQAGQPLEQFVGFDPRAQALLESDPEVQAVVIRDVNGNVVHERTQEAVQSVPEGFAPAPITLQNDQIKVQQNETSYRVILPLRNRFQDVGQIEVSMGRDDVDEKVTARFEEVLPALGAMLGAFVLIQALVTGLTSGRAQRVISQIAFLLVFLVGTAFVTQVMFNIYASGVQARTEALARALGARLGSAVDMGIDLDDFTDIARAFTEYRQINRDIASIALVQNGVSMVHIFPGLQDKIYTRAPNTYEFSDQVGSRPDSALKVAVALPTSAVLREIWSSGKNFLVLFLANAIIAALFLDVGRSLQASRQRRIKDVLRRADQDVDPDEAERDVNDRLTLIRPSYFLVVFLEMLIISFLPQMLTESAQAAGLDQSWASLPFTVYFICFAIVLVPAGSYAERGNLKFLIAWGTILSALGMLAIALQPDYWTILAGRGVSGLGQGLLLIGIQSYLLAVVPPERRTQGAAVQVIGYNGALISGSAIGALLAVFVGFTEVFIIATAIGGLALLYLLIMVPATKAKPHEALSGSATASRQIGLLGGMVRTMVDWQFFKALVLIGGFSKLVLAGVIMFAVPLLLARQGFAQEDIGQLLMIYAAISLMTTFLAARIVDRLGSPKLALAIGTSAAGIGMLVLGLTGGHVGIESMNLPGVPSEVENNIYFLVVAINEALENFPLPYASTAAVILSLGLIGFSHGLIAAPVVTLVAQTRIAARLGAARVTAAYRFMERGGHVLGPILVGQMLVVADGNALVVAVLGAVSILFGIVYTITRAPRPAETA